MEWSGECNGIGRVQVLWEIMRRGVAEDNIRNRRGELGKE